MSAKMNKYVLLIVETSPNGGGTLPFITKELTARNVTIAVNLAKNFIKKNYFSKWVDDTDEPSIAYVMLLDRAGWSYLPDDRWEYEYTERLREEEQDRKEYTRLKAKFEPLVQPVKKQSGIAKKRSPARATKK